jgi:hypothetical protein
MLALIQRQHASQLGGADAARAQDARLRAGQVDNGGLQPEAAVPAIQHCFDTAFHLAHHMGGTGGADVTERVGRRRNHGMAQLVEHGLE